MIGPARAQNITIHQNKSYDLEINTDSLNLDEYADQIVSLMKNKEGLVKIDTLQSVAIS